MQTIIDKSAKEASKRCYLCGGPLSPSISMDHCPPRALFSRGVRKRHNLSQLITIPVHRDCNESYKRDEEYFQAALVPFAPGSEAGDTIFEEFIAKSKKDDSKRDLAEMILREFEPRPGGLHLPSNLVMKRQDGARIQRVAWKIVRGLYFHHHGAILPETLPVGVTMTAPGRSRPEHFELMLLDGLADEDSHGQYPGAFDYRFRTVGTDLWKLNYWALVIWDRVLMTVCFHDPWSCQCEGCTSAIAELDMRTGQPSENRASGMPAAAGRAL